MGKNVQFKIEYEAGFSVKISFSWVLSEIDIRME